MLIEHVEFQVEAGFFLGLGLRVKAVAQVIVLLVAEFLQRVRADVVVGDAQPVGGHERPAAAAVEAHAALLQVVEPRRRRLEAVLLLQLLRRRRVEKPHALVAARTGASGTAAARARTANGADFHTVMRADDGAVGERNDA